MFYPSTLNSSWYKRDVCYMIHSSLQGCVNYFGPSIENEINRKAYMQAFLHCIRLCEYKPFDPHQMVNDLVAYELDLNDIPKPSIFSKRRWFANEAEYRKKAVNQAIELVEGVSERF